MSGVSSYPRTDGRFVSPETIQALLAAGYLTEDDARGYREDLRSEPPTGRELIRNLVRVALKDRRHDAAFLDRVNAGLLQRHSAARNVTVYHHTGARDLAGFSYAQITYIRRGDRNAYRQLRTEFDRKERMAWLKAIATSNRQHLIDSGISDHEVDRMAAEGKAPEGYDVHHRIPLDDGGTNAPDNFILMRNDIEHRALHGYYNPAELRIRLLAHGDGAVVALAVPPGDTLVYPNPSMGYVATSVSYAKFLEVFDEY